MSEHDLKNSKASSQKDLPLAARRRGKAEYLFINPPFVSTSSDETANVLSDEEEYAIAKVVDFF